MARRGEWLYSYREPPDAEAAMPTADDSPPHSQPPSRRVGCAALFLGFLKIGLMGFGGVAPVARHVIVADRGWLTDREYAQVLAMGQILPGANTVNASVMIGDRFQGAMGAVAALLGLMAMPLVILIGLATLYEHFAALAAVRTAIAGSAAAAAGLVIGTAIKIARKLRPDLWAVLFGLGTFAAVGLWALPMLAVVAIAGPLSIAAVAVVGRRS